ncbi:MAG TPA: methionine--tRNA ligase subunit beta, partial [Clostridiaceae bacterium]|nr:methionine--tRNA ligase subunit beta [Clostridiaceae bacterium]
KRMRLGTVLYNLGECLRLVAVLIEPFMPNTPRAIREALRIPSDDPNQVAWESTTEFGRWQPAVAVASVKPLFPRIDVEKEIAALNELHASIEAEKPEKQKEETPADADPVIQFDEFMQVKMVVGVVKSCEKVEGSDKLLCSQVDIGSETRQIVSGISMSYQPEDLVGRKVIVVTNLAPRKIFGKESQGMLLAATDAETDKPYLLTVDNDLAAGAEVS